MTMLRYLLAFALAVLPLADAFPGNGTITTKDAGGVTRTFTVVTDGSGNFIARQVICDQSAGASCASVISNALQVSLTATATTAIATGNVAAGATDSGNPVKVGGISLTTAPTLTDGQRGDVQLDTRGSTKVTPFFNGTTTPFQGLADNADAVAISATTSKLSVLNRNTVFNGTTWDRMPGDSVNGVKVGGSGTAGAPSTAVLTIQGIASMTPLRVTLEGTSASLLVNPGTPASWGIAATAAAPPANAVYISANASGATGGLLKGIIGCDLKATYDGTATGNTELVALTSGRGVYVCGYSILAGGTVNVKLISGTGTACASGSANLTPAFQLTAQTGLVDGSPFWRGLKTPTAEALCINASGSTAVQAIVYYSVL